MAVFLNQEMPLPRMNIVDVAPAQGGFGLEDPKLVAPGDPWNSVLAVRMAKTGSGHMPLIGARHLDAAGLKIIEDWIARLPSTSNAPKPWDSVAWDEATIHRQLATVGGSMRLRRAIDDGKLGPELRAVAFEKAWASPDGTIRDIFERFKPDEQRERMLLIFDILVSLFERAYILVYDENMAGDQLRRWRSWEDYMREWCQREDFRAALPELLHGEDPAFADYIRGLAADVAGAH